MAEFQRLLASFYSIFLAALLASGVLHADTPKNPIGMVPFSPLRPAHEFKMKDLQGNPKTLADYQGKMIILNFWAPWCAPCKEEMPDLNRLHQKLSSEGLVVLGVATSSKLELVLESAQKLNVSFPLLYDDDSKVAMKYGARALPTTYVINKQGALMGMVQGVRSWDSHEALAWFRQQMGQSSRNSVPVIQTKGTHDPIEFVDKNPKMVITAPQIGIERGKIFALQAEIFWLGDPQAYGFDPPETDLPPGINFVSMGQTLNTIVGDKGPINHLTYEIFLMPDEKLMASSFQLGPYQSDYVSDKNEGRIESNVLNVQLAAAKNHNPVASLSIGLGVLALSLGVVWTWRHKGQIKGQNKDQPIANNQEEQ